ncbi:MAG: phosphatase PAP2 family protein [Bacilli bacterium]|nr:phosphatase PAP2 family protein [Bacilli bacterium]
MKRRWIFLPIIGLFLIGLILGSFFDLQINAALYNRNNAFGLTMAALGESPSYAFMAACGMGFALLLKEYKKWWQRVLFILAIIVANGCCIYFQSNHIFDVNAFYRPELKYFGYIAGVGVAVLGNLAGYFLFKFSHLSKKQILAILIFALCLYLISVGINQLTKSLMARPRYRFLADMGVVNQYYRNWWQNGREIKELYTNSPVYFPNGQLITKEEFKSFPSGHMTNTCVIILFAGMLPLINKHIKMKSEWLILIATGYCVLLGFSRMLVGAHYLSDVCMGALTPLLVAYVINEIFTIIYNKIPKEKPVDL